MYLNVFRSHHSICLCSGTVLQCISSILKRVEFNMILCVLVHPVLVN